MVVPLPVVAKCSMILLIFCIPWIVSNSIDHDDHIATERRRENARLRDCDEKV